MWEQCGLVGDRGDAVVVVGEDMPSTRFFPDATLNVAENLLHGWEGDEPALIAHDEAGRRREVTGRELRSEVGRTGRRAQRAGRRRRRSGGGLAPQRCRDGRDDAGRDVARRGVLVVLARLRDGRRARPLRPDRAGGAGGRRRIPVQRRTDRLPQPAAGDPRRPAHAPGHRRRSRPRRAPRPGRAGRRGDVAGVRRPAPRNRPDLRAPALRPSLVRPVLLGDHRAAEVHRPSRRRRAPHASEGAPAPVRHPPGRRRPLLHDHRLDDVELAGLGAGLRRHDRPLRRLAVRTRP